jgi:hypothetical protein
VYKRHTLNNWSLIQHPRLTSLKMSSSKKFEKNDKTRFIQKEYINKGRAMIIELYHTNETKFEVARKAELI